METLHDVTFDEFFDPPWGLDNTEFLGGQSHPPDIDLTTTTTSPHPSSSAMERPTGKRNFDIAFPVQISHASPPDAVASQTSQTFGSVTQQQLSSSLILSEESDNFDVFHSGLSSFPSPKPSEKVETRPIKRSRMPGSENISANEWTPFEPLIRRLYQEERMSRKQIVRILKDEYNFEKANDRKLLYQIQKMGIERNVKANDRAYIVRQTEDRERRGKKSGCIRVRGTRVENQLARWKKEIKSTLHTSDTADALPAPPSPGNLTIKTFSTNAGSISLLENELANEYMNIHIGEKDIMKRLLTYVQAQKPRRFTIKGSKARAILNDIQTFLGPGFSDSAVESDIAYVRNQMNLAQTVLVDPNWSRTYRPVPPLKGTGLVRPVQGSPRVMNWDSPSAIVQTFFRNTPKISSFTMNDMADSKEALMARLILVSKDVKSTPFCLSFDFTPHYNPTMTISYQAMVPNNSEIFKVVKSGNLINLIALLEKPSARRASLTDRDEKGRSLLNYAIRYKHPDMCKFLINNGADVNAFEKPFWTNDHSSVFCFSLNRVNLTTIEEVERSVLCKKLLLDSGLDISLELFVGGQSIFTDIVLFSEVDLLKYALDSQVPFASPDGIVHCWRCRQGHPALIVLASQCGYGHDDNVNILEKAVLILSRKADISVRGCCGNTVLHTILSSRRLDEYIPRTCLYEPHRLARERASSISEPKELLSAFVAAGADVYATNDHGFTPSMIAIALDRLDEWYEALEFCGYDADQVMDGLCENPKFQMSERQTSKVTFEEWFQDWQKRRKVDDLTYSSVPRTYHEYLCRCLLGEPIIQQMQSLREYEKSEDISETEPETEYEDWEDDDEDGDESVTGHPNDSQFAALA